MRTVYIILFILISGCSTKQNNYFIRVDNAGGITNAARVEMRGVTIGQVDQIFFDAHNRVILKIAIDKQIAPSSDASFIIRHPLGTTDIYMDIMPGSASTIIQPGDTIEGTFADPALLRDSIGNSIKQILIDPRQSAHQDSVLQELKKLNQNIEELRKERE